MTPDNTPVFNLDYFLQADEVFHIARVNISSRQDLTYHSHDYAEIFWIENGVGYNHINGKEIKVSAGDLYMIRPEDCHTFSSSGDGLTLVNIAFSKDTLTFLRARYFPHSTKYFWTTADIPFHITLSEDILKRLSTRAEETMRQKRNIIQQDSFLLFLFRQISDYEYIEEFHNVPEWLVNAIKMYNNPNCFMHGIPYFVSLCDRNEDHINRVIKQHLGKTLISLITEIKMRYATIQLAMTNMPIKEICHNCGYKNLAHFYKLFSEAYKMTPKQYRKINQKIV